VQSRVSVGQNIAKNFRRRYKAVAVAGTPKTFQRKANSAVALKFFTATN